MRGVRGTARARQVLNTLKSFELRVGKIEVK